MEAGSFQEKSVCHEESPHLINMRRRHVPHRCEDTIIRSWLDEHTVPFCSSLWKVGGSSFILIGIQSCTVWKPISIAQGRRRTTAMADLITTYHEGPCQS